MKKNPRYGGACAYSCFPALVHRCDMATKMAHALPRKGHALTIRLTSSASLPCSSCWISRLFLCGDGDDGKSSIQNDNDDDSDRYRPAAVSFSKSREQRESQRQRGAKKPRDGSVSIRKAKKMSTGTLRTLLGTLRAFRCDVFDFGNTW